MGAFTIRLVQKVRFCEILAENKMFAAEITYLNAPKSKKIGRGEHFYFIFF